MSARVRERGSKVGDCSLTLSKALTVYQTRASKRIATFPLYSGENAIVKQRPVCLCEVAVKFAAVAALH